MTLKLLSLTIAAGLAMSAPVANAAIYNFTQTGYEEGATIFGSFEANDLTSNGKIEGSIYSNFSEISAFTVSFSGNSLVSAFTHSLSNLEFLIYNPARSVLGDQGQEVIATNWFGTTGFFYITGVGTGEQGGYVENLDTGLWSHSENLVNVTPAAVPVPGAVWLFGSALAGFIGAARRKKAN
ncbi:MAG: VPLPA-CTERM sorting domain-containing protein [Methylococcales bacterium]|nr:VPLPA-CTERM sorting domain-containing protein [Methylococcales bacterium]